jgi:hypothetical protein
MAEFRKATQEIKESFDLDEDIKEVQKDLADSVSGIESWTIFRREKERPSTVTSMTPWKRRRRRLKLLQK